MKTEDKKIAKKPYRAPVKKAGPKRQAYDPGKIVYIGNLRYNFDDKALLGLFGKFGKVKRVNLITDSKTEKSKGIAFIHMERRIDADKAIDRLNGYIIGGRTVKVSEAIESEPEKKKIVAFKKSKNQKEEKEDEIVVHKKRPRRKSGLEELFKNTGKKC